MEDAHRKPVVVATPHTQMTEDGTEVLSSVASSCDENVASSNLHRMSTDWDNQTAQPTVYRGEGVIEILSAFDALHNFDGEITQSSINCEENLDEYVECLSRTHLSFRSFWKYFSSLNGLMFMLPLLFYLPTLVLLFWALDLAHKKVDGTLTPSTSAAVFNAQTFSIFVYNGFITVFQIAMPLFVASRHSEKVNRRWVFGGLCVQFINLVQVNFLGGNNMVFNGVTALLVIGSCCCASAFRRSHSRFQGRDLQLEAHHRRWRRSQAAAVALPRWSPRRWRGRSLPLRSGAG